MARSEVEAILTKLRTSGHRVTPQRQAVVQVMVGRTDHPTAEDVFRRVGAQFPMVARSTIYDILEALVGIGECVELFPEPSARRFDPRVEPHSHFVCTSCKRIFDLALEPPEVNPNSLREMGFRVKRQAHEFYGECPKCANRAVGAQGLAPLQHDPLGN